MGRVFKFLGLTVGIVTDATPYAARGKQFDTDVLYITAMQLTFTYLYDNTARYSYQVVSLFGRAFKPLFSACVIP